MRTGSDLPVSPPPLISPHTHIRLRSCQFAYQHLVGSHQRQRQPPGQRDVRGVAGGDVVGHGQRRRLLRQVRRGGALQRQPGQVGHVLLRGLGRITVTPRVLPEDVRAFDEEQVRHVEPGRRCGDQVGTLIQGGPLPGRVAERFLGLMENGVLRRVKPTQP